MRLLRLGIMIFSLPVHSICVKLMDVCVHLLFGIICAHLLLNGISLNMKNKNWWDKKINK